jgi:hypothetical protein
MVAFRQLGRDDEVFSWMDRHGVLTHIASTRLRVYLAGADWPVSDVALRPEFVLAVASQNGLEEQHLDAYPLTKLNEPAIMLDRGDGTHTVADGSHRLVKRALLGMPNVPTYLVPEAVWRRFAIPDMPEHVLGWREWLATANPDAGRFHDVPPPGRAG